ncbi:MAG: hypothetical protein ABIA93_07595 [Candidatus Woesearchaeota archaeon]
MAGQKSHEVLADVVKHEWSKVDQKTQKEVDKILEMYDDKFIHALQDEDFEGYNGGVNALVQDLYISAKPEIYKHLGGLKDKDKGKQDEARANALEALLLPFISKAKFSGGHDIAESYKKAKAGLKAKDRIAYLGQLAQRHLGVDEKAVNALYAGFDSDAPDERKELVAKKAMLQFRNKLKETLPFAYIGKEISGKVNSHKEPHNMDAALRSRSYQRIGEEIGHTPDLPEYVTTTGPAAVGLYATTKAKKGKDDLKDEGWVQYKK